MFSSGLPCNISFPNCLSGRSAKEDSSEELLPANMGNREPVILNVYDMVSSFIHFSYDIKNVMLPDKMHTNNVGNL